MEATATLNYGNSRFDELLEEAKKDWEKPPEQRGWADKLFHENENLIAASEEARAKAARKRAIWDFIRTTFFLVGLITLGIWKALNL